MVGGHWRCTQMRQRLPFGKVTPQMIGQNVFTEASSTANQDVHF
jgi:hypothetical protein